MPELPADDQTGGAPWAPVEKSWQTTFHMDGFPQTILFKIKEEYSSNVPEWESGASGEHENTPRKMINVTSVEIDSPSLHKGYQIHTVQAKQSYENNETLS